MTINKIELQSILDKAVDNKKVFGTSFCLSCQGESWCGGSGNLDTDSQFFIASVTKLFVTALILNAASNSVLSLDDKASDYLRGDVIEGLHSFQSMDYSDRITIRHLLAHTSGIPDYFQGKSSQGISLENEITQAKDRRWTFEDVMALAKSMRPHFAPGASGKAHYSDTNFQLLGKVVEAISGKSLEENFNEVIIRPLDLSKTYLYLDTEDTRPASLYFKEKELIIPKAMSSFTADGGMVSTANDLMIFLRAFFSGRLFPSIRVDELRTWNRIFFPFQAGIGIQRFRMPWIMDPFRSIPDLIGHSGLSGTVAFYDLEKEIYVTGAVNQVAYPGTSIKLALKLIRQF